MKKRKKGREFTGVTIVFMCHDGHGNIVMLKRNDNARDEQGKWDIGGGGLEFGDTVLGTLEKEIKEEYTTDIISHEFLGYRDVHRVDGDGSSHWIALDFLVHIDREKVSIGEPHKFTDLQWFAYGNFPENSHSQLPRFLEKHKEQLENIFNIN